MMEAGLCYCKNLKLDKSLYCLYDKIIFHLGLKKIWWLILELSGNIEEASKAVVGDELCHRGRGMLKEYDMKNSKKGWLKKET